MRIAGKLRAKTAKCNADIPFLFRVETDTGFLCANNLNTSAAKHIIKCIFIAFIFVYGLPEAELAAYINGV
jgi:hypothetical protein